MCRNDTFAIAVSSTSMNAETEMTVATSHGLRSPAAERSADQLPAVAAAPAIQRTRISGTTDSPGPSGQSPRTLSKRIFTGTRCTTFT